MTSFYIKYNFSFFYNKKKKNKKKIGIYKYEDHYIMTDYLLLILY